MLVKLCVSHRHGSACALPSSDDSNLKDKAVDLTAPRMRNPR
jgi:hypothetical protein